MTASQDVFTDAFLDSFGAGFSSVEPLSVPAFDAGYAPEPDDFDAWIQAPFAFLTSRVVFRASLNSTTVNLPVGNSTLIPWDTVIEDPFGGWQASQKAWQCPAEMSGTYLVTLTGAAQGSSDTASTLRPQVGMNGSPGDSVGIGWATASQIGLVSGSVPVQLFGGQDTVSGYIFWAGNNGGQMSTTGGRHCTIEISWYSL